MIVIPVIIAVVVVGLWLRRRAGGPSAAEKLDSAVIEQAAVLDAAVNQAVLGDGIDMGPIAGMGMGGFGGLLGSDAQRRATGAVRTMLHAMIARGDYLGYGYNTPEGVHQTVAIKTDAWIAANLLEDSAARDAARAALLQPLATRQRTVESTGGPSFFDREPSAVARAPNLDAAYLTRANGTYTTRRTAGILGQPPTYDIGTDSLRDLLRVGPDKIGVRRDPNVLGNAAARARVVAGYAPADAARAAALTAGRVAGEVYASERDRLAVERDIAARLRDPVQELARRAAVRARMSTGLKRSILLALERSWAAAPVLSPI